jgi:hypothetical protein
MQIGKYSAVEKQTKDELCQCHLNHCAMDQLQCTRYISLARTYDINVLQEREAAKKIPSGGVGGLFLQSDIHNFVAKEEYPPYKSCMTHLGLGLFHSSSHEFGTESCRK